MMLSIEGWTGCFVYIQVSVWFDNKIRVASDYCNGVLDEIL